MRVFVTGGSGYIGQATIRALRRGGHQVAALVRSEASAQVVIGLGATAVRGGLGDLDGLRAAATQADGVIHLAQAAGPGTAQADQAASAALQDGIGAGPYVHTGGTWVYGDTAGVADEGAPFAPPSLVAWRLDNEKLVLDRAAAGGRPVLVVPGLVYGAGAGLIEQFVIAPARTRGAVHYIGTGANHWSLVHVDDLADLYVLALDAPAGSVFAGVGDYRHTVADLVPALAQAAGCPGRAESISLAQARDELGPLADAFALDQQISGDRARTKLGWAPPARDVLAELARPGVSLRGL
jgi:nucleoside-diphosphate-sugar epimerase